jgi:hypothetical protein
VYSVPAGDVRTGVAEALPAKAISEAAAMTSRPRIFRCFMSSLLDFPGAEAPVSHRSRVCSGTAEGLSGATAIVKDG